MIGSFGNIVFETSGSKIFTFNEFKRKGSARFAEHAVLEGKPRLQHIGPNLDVITFNVRLDMSLGVTPADEMAAFREVLESGDEQKLIIGGTVLGNFVLETLDEERKVTTNKGKLVLADLNLTIKEFVDE